MQPFQDLISIGVRRSHFSTSCLVPLMPLAASPALYILMPHPQPPLRERWAQWMLRLLDCLPGVPQFTIVWERPRPRMLPKFLPCTLPAQSALWVLLGSLL